MVVAAKSVKPDVEVVGAQAHVFDAVKAQFDGVNLPELIEYRVIETLLLVENGEFKKAHVNLSSGDKSRAASSFFHFLAK